MHKLHNWLIGVHFRSHPVLAENNLVLYSDAVFHAALDSYAERLPPIVERCTMFLEYYNDGQCGTLDVLITF